MIGIKDMEKKRKQNENVEYLFMALLVIAAVVLLISAFSAIPSIKEAMTRNSDQWSINMFKLFFTEYLTGTILLSLCALSGSFYYLAHKKKVAVS
jgi:NADH:ubiquinone oxidoreductase subunit 6 (subunit J)